MDKAEHGDIEHPVETYYPLTTPAFQWPEIQKVAYWYSGVLDDGMDTDSLLMLFVNNTSAASIPADEDCDMLLRFDNRTGEVAGIEIDDFEHHFLRKHPELADGWAALKPEGKNGFHNTPWLTGDAALAYARRLKEMACQGTIAPGWPFDGLDSIAVRDKSA